MASARILLLGLLVLCPLLSCSRVPSTPAPPDFTGVWMAFAVENPEGGGNTPKYSPEGLAKLEAYSSQFKSIPETGMWCLGLGMPSVMMSMVTYPIQIVQTPKLMVMLAELEMQLRRIHLDGRGHSDELLPSSAGHSIGTFEGDTLVVDTAMLSEWLLRPWPRSEQAHISERIRMTKLSQVKPRATGVVAGSGKPINDDVLVIEMTLTDPVYYASPQRRITYYQRMDDTITLEYLCATEHWVDQLEKQRISPAQ